MKDLNKKMTYLLKNKAPNDLDKNSDGDEDPDFGRK